MEIVNKNQPVRPRIQNINKISQPKKKCGRKSQVFFVDGKILEDEYLFYLIDNGFYKIRQLERVVGAGKNQLRGRYERYKEKVRKER